MFITAIMCIPNEAGLRNVGLSISAHLRTPPTVPLRSSCTAACPRQLRWHPRRRVTATDLSDGLSALVWSASHCSSALS